MCTHNRLLTSSVTNTHTTTRRIMEVFGPREPPQNELMSARKILSFVVFVSFHFTHAIWCGGHSITLNLIQIRIWRGMRKIAPYHFQLLLLHLRMHKSIIWLKYFDQEVSHVVPLNTSNFDTRTRKSSHGRGSVCVCVCFDLFGTSQQWHPIWIL